MADWSSILGEINKAGAGYFGGEADAQALRATLLQNLADRKLKEEAERARLQEAAGREQYQRQMLSQQQRTGDLQTQIELLKLKNAQGAGPNIPAAETPQGKLAGDLMLTNPGLAFGQAWTQAGAIMKQQGEEKFKQEETLARFRQELKPRSESAPEKDADKVKAAYTIWSDPKTPQTLKDHYEKAFGFGSGGKLSTTERTAFDNAKALNIDIGKTKAAINDFIQKHGMMSKTDQTLDQISKSFHGFFGGASPEGQEVDRFLNTLSTQTASLVGEWVKSLGARGISSGLLTSGILSHVPDLKKYPLYEYINQLDALQNRADTLLEVYGQKQGQGAAPSGVPEGTDLYKP